MKKMGSKQEKFVRGVLKTKREYGLDDDQMGEYIVPTMEKRDQDYKKSVAHRYGKPLAVAVTKWWQSLSALDKRRTGAETSEEIYQAYLVNNPNKVSSKDVAKALGRDKRKAPIHDSTYDELGPPEYGEDGRVRPGKKMVLKRIPPREPTASELKRMSQKEIADLIIQISDYHWPGGGGNQEAPGIEGVGVEDSK